MDMDNRIKVIYSLKSFEGIEKIIEKWADENGFHEYSHAESEGLVDVNNVTYCYCLDRNRTKTFLTIHYIDEMVRLETWVSEDIINK